MRRADSSAKDFVSDYGQYSEEKAAWLRRRMHGNLNAVRANSKSGKTKGFKALLQRSRSQAPASKVEERSGINDIGGGKRKMKNNAAAPGKQKLSPLKRNMKNTSRVRGGNERHGKDAHKYELSKAKAGAALGVGLAKTSTERGKKSPSAGGDPDDNVKAAKAKRRDELKGRRYNKGNILPARWQGGVEGGVAGGGYKSERPSTVGPERKLHKSWSSQSSVGRRAVLSRSRLPDTWSYAHLETAADVMERQRKSVGFQL